MNRIFRRVLEFSARDRAEGERLRRGARGLWEDALLPGLERACDACSEPATVRRFRRVEVELRVGARMSDAEIGALFEGSLKEQLGGARAASQTGWTADEMRELSELSPEQLRRERVEHFLAKGRLPWSAPLMSLAEIVALVDDEIRTSGAQWLREFVLREKRVAARLARQFSPEQSAVWLAVFAPRVAAVLSRLLAEFAKAASSAAPFLEVVWTAWARTEAGEFERWLERVSHAISHEHGESAAEYFASLSPTNGAAAVRSIESAQSPANDGRHLAAKDAAAVRDGGEISSTPAAEREATSASVPVLREPESERESLEAELPIPVVNAGMILLAVFLPTLFERVGIVPSAQPSERRNVEKAPLLLHFAATGEVEAAESALVLPKLLAGWPLDEPALCRDALEALNCEAADGLLDAVLAQWTALRNTSREGLRSSFLQRPGLLRRTEQGWQLHIERRGYDILLDRLPWTIGVVRLSWMNAPLFVEWSANE